MTSVICWQFVYIMQLLPHLSMTRMTCYKFLSMVMVQPSYPSVGSGWRYSAVCGCTKVTPLWVGGMMEKAMNKLYCSPSIKMFNMHIKYSTFMQMMTMLSDNTYKYASIYEKLISYWGIRPNEHNSVSVSLDLSQSIFKEYGTTWFNWKPIWEECIFRNMVKHILCSIISFSNPIYYTHYVRVRFYYKKKI